MFAATYIGPAEWAARSGSRTSTGRYTALRASWIFERGGRPPVPYQLTLPRSAWFHQRSEIRRSISSWTMVDIVSKKGCVLLNVSPAPAAPFPRKPAPVARHQRLVAHQWRRDLWTRPWQVYGEGPTGQAKQLQREGRQGITSLMCDLTREISYAIALAWPEDNTMLVRSLFEPSGKISGVPARARRRGCMVAVGRRPA